MAKLRKKHLDELDLELLSLLYYKGEATATDLEKELENKITKAGISKRLKWLAEHGYLAEPEVDISTGKLKKIYKAPAKEKLKEALLEWYRAKIYNPITEAYVRDTKTPLKEAYTEYPPEEAYKDDRISMLSLTPAKALRKLREGLSLEEAIKLFKIELEEDYPYTELFSYEIFDLIAVKNGTVKLTKEGLKAVLNEWIPEIREKLKELRELDYPTYKQLLAQFCKDLS